MLRFTLFSVGLLLISNSALAQTACPSGVAPGSPQCGPDAGTSRDDAPAQQPRFTGEWIKTWGAIAGSDNTTQAWASTGMTSKKAAEQDALDQCESAGFMGCKVEFTYRNQCVALASSTSTQSKTGMAGAPELEQAEANAMKLCEQNGASCSVIYTDCTKPIFKKY